MSSITSRFYQHSYYIGAACYALLPYGGYHDDTLHAPLRIIALALGLGIAADVLFYERALGISAPLFAPLCLAVLLSSARTEARHMQPANLWLGMAALLFAGFLRCAWSQPCAFLMH